MSVDERARVTVWVVLLLCLTFLVGHHVWKAGRNRPLTPDEAVAAMSVPAGFAVELVASEPRIAHPIAMTSDERGRLWLVESSTGPADSPSTSPGRIKILESSRGDGTFDKLS